MVTIIFIIFCFMTILPITILLHELGHAICAVLCNANKIVVSIGCGKIVKEFKYNAIKFILHRIPFGGKTFYELTKCKSYKSVIISIGGPILNGIVAFLLLLPGMGYGDHFITAWFQWLALFNLWMFVVNSIPFKVREQYSDGWIALKTFRAINNKKV